MKKKIFNLIKISLGIIILVVLFYKLGIKEIIETLKIMNFYYLIPIYLIIFLSLFLSTIGIYVLVKQLKKKIKLKELFRYVSISWSTGLFFPGKIGELSLLYFFKKHKINIGHGSSIWFMDKITSLIVVSILSIIGFLIFFGKHQTLILAIFLLLFFFLIFIFIVSNRLRGLIKKYVLRKHEKHFKGFSSLTIIYFKQHKKYLFINVIVTIIRTILDSIMFFLIFLSFNKIIPLFYIILIWAMEVIISMIPITINGLGIKQSVSTYLYNIIGVPLPIIGARHVINLLTQYTTGLFFILTTKEKHLTK